ncbi:uncharacterized protein KY384_005839 [Bacidia gigantensis]|uniref:uncharacterized protein n=1 Tax=Bacidia gigantensis TaxID=2732470 RepID=UPI001D0537B2|nr:uncharacterized protein KY384_005839 [Bacidia gigantensis]KAG8529204.1 hypothetical protein KY384_005839 [Bacidia gigantensis]
MDSRPTYIPPPPPPPQQQSHVLNLPPPPPRPPAANAPHSMVPPPPPGPPPSATNMPAQWTQQGWGRLPPPPPLGPNQIGAKQNQYPNHAYDSPSPPQSEAVVSATYIPGGESFGPGVGIPPLYTQQEQEPAFARDDSFSYSHFEAGMLHDQRFFNGPSSAISPSKELPAFNEHMSGPGIQLSQNRQGVSQHASTPMSTTVPNGQSQTNSDQVPSSASGHGRSSSSGLLSPNDPAREWPPDRVSKWLEANSFSEDWQETFRSLNIQGRDFLDLGRANNGRGNFGMMHQQVYPRLARVCGMSGSGWNQEREQKEGRRMRRLVRAIAESAETFRGHGRRESVGLIPSASTDGGVETSPNPGSMEAFSQTPSTAGVEDESPGKFFRSPAPALNPRMASKTRSSTAPTAIYSQVGATASDTGLAEMAQMARSGYSRGILSNINDAASKRHHSPSASSDTGTGSTFIGDAIRNTYDASPQSGSPSTQHSTLVGGGALSAPPHNRIGHRKTGSTDSTASRRNGIESHRPTALDIGPKNSHADPPSSAKELSKGFLERFRKRKKDHDSSHPSPEDHSQESPTSPQNHRYMPPSQPFAKGGRNYSTTSLERPSSASTQMSEHERLSRERAFARGLRRYAFVTADQWNYRLVDITEAESSLAIREAICRGLNYGENDVDMALLYLTEPGQIEHDDPISDSMLLFSKHSKADSSGALKIFVRRGPNSASLMPPPLSAGLGIGMSPKASPPPGSVFPRKAVDEDGYNRIRVNGMARSRSPPLASRQNTLKASDPASATNMNGDADKFAALSDITTAKQKLQTMKTARESGSVSDADWASWLEAAVEEFQQDVEKKTTNRAEGGKVAGESQKERTVNFDTPKRSPYEPEKKTDPLVPTRKPPAPPASSQMLEKANSLTRKAGDSARSSLSGPSSQSNRKSIGDPVEEEVHDQSQTKPATGLPPSGGIGAALVNAGDVSSSVGRLVGSRRNNPTLNAQAQRQNMMNSGKLTRDLPFDINSRTAKAIANRMSIPLGSDNQKPNLALQTQMFRNPSKEKMRKRPSPQHSPTSGGPPSRKSSTASRPRSYGPAYFFKENEISFDRPPPVPQLISEDDSDDGLFAKPLAGKVQAARKSVAEDSNGSRRPTLTLDTDQRSRKSKGLSVSWKKSPDLPTDPSTAQSSNTTDLDNDSRTSSFGKSDRRTPESDDPTSVSADSPDITKISRRQSFMRDDVWANRPPTEDLLNNLDAFFPNLDLDEPVVEDMVGSTPTSPSANDDHNPLDSAASEPQAAGRRMIRSSLYDRIRPESIAEEPETETLGSEESTLRSRAPMSSGLANRSVRKSGGLGRMKSIRDVARGAHEGSSKRNTQIHTPGIPSIPMSSDIVRRKSTKMFGANIVQVKPGRGSRVSLIEAVPKQAPGPPANSFQIARGQLIGKGSYGKVYLGMNLTTGDFLAVKQVDVSQRAAGNDKDRMKDMVAALDQEIDTMQHLEHPNIVQYLGCERKDFSISIFLEYISGGSVGSCLRKHGKFEESLVSSLTRQTLGALAYLHQEGVLHRDLKADNILLDIDGTCKISDFGISKKTDNIYGNDITNNMQGSVFWMAPEVVRSQGQGYSAKVDIWSLGCVVLEMFAGRRPWSKDEAVGAIYKLGTLNQAPPIPDDVSQAISAQALSFMLDCFTIDPRERPTAGTLLQQQPFFGETKGWDFAETELARKLREGDIR